MPVVRFRATIALAMSADDLTAKLKSLGVKVGARDLPPPQPKVDFPIERVIPGQAVETTAGEAYLVETFYRPEDGRTRPVTAALDALAAWARAASILESPPEAFAFLDIETTGLSGGVSTYAFMVGVGRYEAGAYRLAQFFMRHPSEEQAHLLALESFLAPCQVLVTFNGKAFDVPLLNARYAYHAWRSPFNDLAQLDLLHISRRLWRDRLTSRKLGDLETYILGITRSQEDIPGWLVPQMYYDYIQTGDARPLSGVFYHNAMDVLSMSALLDHLAHLLADPLDGPNMHDLERVAIGRLFEDLGWRDAAIQVYRRSLQTPLPDDLRHDTLRRLSFLHKRRAEWEDAMSLWQEAAAYNQVYAFVELAKVCEHERRDAAAAFAWARAALELVTEPDFPHLERILWQPELEKRLERLQQKIGRR